MRMLVALVLGATSCEVLGYNETMNYNRVKTIVGKFVIAMEGEWALADSSVVARQLGHRTRLIAVIAMVSVSSANSKALESAYALQLLELPVERLDGPPVPPASCWLLREGDGALDGPP